MANTAALLDPRTFHHISQANHLVGNVAVITDYIGAVYASTKRTLAVQEPDSSDVPIPDEGAPENPFLSALAVTSSMNHFAKSSFERTAEEAAKTATEEIHRYAAAVKVYLGSIPEKDRLSSDPFEFWRAQLGNFPVLGHIARVLLPAQATSAASEEAFSSAGFIMSPHRASMSVDSLELAVVLRNAIKNGFNIHDAYFAHLQVKKADANRKRSATQKANVAKKKQAGTGAGAAVGGVPVPILLDADKDEDEVVGAGAGASSEAAEAAEQKAAAAAEKAARRKLELENKAQRFFGIAARAPLKADSFEPTAPPAELAPDAPKLYVSFAAAEDEDELEKPEPWEASMWEFDEK